MMRRFFKDSIIYALPMFLARAIGLILLPIYTRELGPVDFGFIEFVAAMSTILLLILPLEINQAVARLLPESEDISRRRAILSSTLWFTGGMFIFFGIVVYFCKYPILKLTNLSDNYAQYIGIVCGSFLVSSIINLLQIQFRFTGQAAASVAVNLTVVLMNMVLVIYFISVGTLGIEQYFWSQVMSSLAGIILGLVIATRKYGQIFFSLDALILRELLKYSLPIVLSSIGMALSGTVDKIMVGSYVGLTELGYYGVTARLASIVGLGFYVISTAMTPIVYREHKNPETKELIAFLFNFSVAVLLALLALTTVAAEPIIVFIAGDKFVRASDYLFYLMLSTVLANLYIFFLGMDIAKNTQLLSKINIISGGCGAFCCVIFVPLYGIWGAILSTLLANAARFSGYVYFSQKLYAIPVKLHWIVLAVATLIVLRF